MSLLWAIRRQNGFFQNLRARTGWDRGVIGNRNTGQAKAERYFSRRGIFRCCRLSCGNKLKQELHDMYPWSLQPWLATKIKSDISHTFSFPLYFRPRKQVICTRWIAWYRAKLNTANDGSVSPISVYNDLQDSPFEAESEISTHTPVPTS
jgi:hypothetical protein